MPTDPCYHSSFENCLNSKTRLDGYECCVETPPPNVKSRLGLWVREGTCNRKTGHCKSDETPKLPDLTENYMTNTRENYEKDHCKKWKLAFFILLCVSFITLVFLLRK